jgi:hypothetical protein
MESCILEGKQVLHRRDGGGGIAHRAPDAGDPPQEGATGGLAGDRRRLGTKARARHNFVRRRHRPC